MPELDDAAAAALFAIAHERFENIGLLYQDGAGFSRTPTQTRDQEGNVRGQFVVPHGSLRGLFHNHPHLKGTNASSREKFSDDDIEQAIKLGVPSYISAGDRVMRFDPRTGKTEEVLAEFPIAEMLEQIDRL